MRKFTILLALMLFIGLQVVQAQRTISGTVTGYDDGLGIPGVTVLSYNEVARETNIESVATAKLKR